MTRTVTSPFLFLVDKFTAIVSALVLFEVLKQRDEE